MMSTNENPFGPFGKNNALMFSDPWQYKQYCKWCPLKDQPDWRIEIFYINMPTRTVLVYKLRSYELLEFVEYNDDFHHITITPNPASDATASLCAPAGPRDAGCVSTPTSPPVLLTTSSPIFGTPEAAKVIDLAEHRDQVRGASSQLSFAYTPGRLDNETSSQSKGNDTQPAKNNSRATNGHDVDVDAGFAEFWKVYPRKIDKQDAAKVYARLIKSGVDAGVILAGTRRYAAEQAADPRNRDEVRKFTKHPSTFLNKRSFENEAEPALPASRSTSGNRSSNIDPAIQCFGSHEAHLRAALGDNDVSPHDALKKREMIDVTPPKDRKP